VSVWQRACLWVPGEWHEETQSLQGSCLCRGQSDPARQGGDIRDDCPSHWMQVGTGSWSGSPQESIRSACAVPSCYFHIPRAGRILREEDRCGNRAQTGPVAFRRGSISRREAAFSRENTLETVLREECLTTRMSPNSLIFGLFWACGEGDWWSNVVRFALGGSLLAWGSGQKAALIIKPGKT